jgi:hypothetical protein
MNIDNFIFHLNNQHIEWKVENCFERRLSAMCLGAQLFQRVFYLRKRIDWWIFVVLIFTAMRILSLVKFQNILDERFFLLLKMINNEELLWKTIVEFLFFSFKSTQ